MLLLNAEEETVAGFIDELQRRLNPRPLASRFPALSGSASSPELHTGMQVNVFQGPV